MKETELDEPVRKWLEKQGYSISCEVKNCDIVARKDDELIIVELKTRFSLDLVYQAVNRKNLTDSVYVAVPVLVGKKTISKYKDVKKLLARLEVETQCIASLRLVVYYDWWYTTIGGILRLAVYCNSRQDPATV